MKFIKNLFFAVISYYSIFANAYSLSGNYTSQPNENQIFLEARRSLVTFYCYDINKSEKEVGKGFYIAENMITTSFDVGYRMTNNILCHRFAFKSYDNSITTIDNSFKLFINAYANVIVFVSKNKMSSFKSVLINAQAKELKVSSEVLFFSKEHSNKQNLKKAKVANIDFIGNDGPESFRIRTQLDYNLLGSPIFNIMGEVVGIVAKYADRRSQFSDIAPIGHVLASFKREFDKDGQFMINTDVSSKKQIENEMKNSCGFFFKFHLNETHNLIFDSESVLSQSNPGELCYGLMDECDYLAENKYLGYILMQRSDSKNVNTIHADFKDLKFYKLQTKKISKLFEKTISSKNIQGLAVKEEEVSYDYNFDGVPRSIVQFSQSIHYKNICKINTLLYSYDKGFYRTNKEVATKTFEMILKSLEHSLDD